MCNRCDGAVMEPSKIERISKYRNLETGLVREFRGKPFYGKWEFVSVVVKRFYPNSLPFYNIVVSEGCGG